MYAAYSSQWRCKNEDKTLFDHVERVADDRLLKPSLDEDSRAKRVEELITFKGEVEAILK